MTQDNTHWMYYDMTIIVDVKNELLDRLEAAENDAAHQKALAESALRVAEGWERKCDELRAKIEEMEKRIPEEVEVREDEGHIFSRGSYNEGYDNGWNDCRNAMLAAAQEAKP